MIGRTDKEFVMVKAAVLRNGGEPLRIESLRMEGPRDDEILVRIWASGICHTDIDFCDSWSGGAVILGHEGAGVAEDVGLDVKSVRKGDHVVLSYQTCGKCRQCRNGRPAHCDKLWDANFGFQRLDGSNSFAGSGAKGHFFGQSSFANYSLATERNVVKVSKNMPLELIAPLGCGIQTGAGTVMNSLMVSAGEGLAVFGTGTVGLSAIMAARLAGASPIIGVDIVPKRLELALELGATHAIDSRNRATVSKILKITAAGVHYAVDTTGSPEIQQAAVDVLKPKGVLALLTGEKGGDRLPQGKRTLGIIQGDAVPQQFIPELIRLFRAGKFPFDRLVKFYDFKDINTAIADSKSGKTVKPVLKMR